MRIKINSLRGFKMKCEMVHILQVNKKWQPGALCKCKKPSPHAKPLYEVIETYFGIKTEWDEELCASVFVLGDSEASTMYALMMGNCEDDIE